MDQNNSNYGHFSRRDFVGRFYYSHVFISCIINKDGLILKQLKG